MVLLKKSMTEELKQLAYQANCKYYQEHNFKHITYHYHLKSTYLVNGNKCTELKMLCKPIKFAIIIDY